MKKFHTISMLLGGVLLIILIWSIKPWQLWQNPGMLSWGFLAFILIDGMAGILFTFGWRCCLSDPYRDLEFFHIYRIYLAGSAINYLTPTAALGGELTKATLLSRSHKGPEAATAVIIGKLAHALAQLLLVIFGSLTISWIVTLPADLSLPMVAGSIVIGAGILTFLAIQKAGRLGDVIRWMVRHRLGGSIMEKAADHISRVDQALKAFYSAHPRRLPAAVMWNMAAMLCGVLQCWVFLSLLSPAASIVPAAGIWLLGSWMDLVAFAVPNDIGVLEGTRVIAFKALGFEASLGLTFGIVYRLAQVCWGAAGLVLYAILLTEKGNAS